MPVGPILVWGAGAVGGAVAGHLARAGRDVTVVDLDEAHLAAIRGGGLHVAGPGGPFVARLAALHPSELTGKFETVLLAVKAHRTREAAEAIRPFLGADGFVVSLQNGLCEIELAETLGRERVVGAFINFGSDVTGPGEIKLGNCGAFVLGELDGAIRPRTRESLSLVRDFEPNAIVTDDIWGYLWGKIAYSSLLKASALSDGTLADFIADPSLRDVHVGLIREVLAAASAAGVTPRSFDSFDPAPFAAGEKTAMDRAIAAMADFNRASAKTHSSAWQDLAQFRRKSDCAAQLAPVFAEAERRGVPMPYNRAMIDLIGEVEQGRANQGPRLVATLAAAGATTKVSRRSASSNSGP